MKINRLAGLMVFLAAVLFSYSSVNAQVAGKTTDTATKTKDTTADSAKKPVVVVTDNLQKPADTTTSAAKPMVKSSKTFGGTTVSLVENVTGEPVREGGKYYTTTSWDGTKWVSKRSWFPDKKP
jgi:hypothetical protein